ncbi:hypothetical protein F2981_22620 (plasmid) [Sinorhizobium meliloti]|nr:hypothetical protein [Sinorhizobium meliloti]
MSAQAVSDLLYHPVRPERSLRHIERHARASGSEDPRASFAIDHFVPPAARSTPACWPQPWGPRCFCLYGRHRPKTPRRSGPVFPKGLAWARRAARSGRKRCRCLGHLEGRKPASRFHVMPTDEELMIARHTLAIIRAP